MLLDKIYYVVERLEGDYAYLRREEGDASGEMMEYTQIE